MATDTAIIIGTIDEMQKLHIRTIPLGEAPRRITHQESSKVHKLIKYFMYYIYYINYFKFIY